MLSIAMSIRPPANAGSFYPADPKALAAEVGDYLDGAECETDLPEPKALIAPHAGYRYSGPIAGSAYARLQPLRDRIRRVVLLGPSHYVPFHGLAVPASDVTAFATPLGDVPLDRECLNDLVAAFPQVTARHDAHEQEHALEVHLPFLQRTLWNFELVPLVVGDADPEEIAAVIDELWQAPETLIVVSSDLSHYHDYVTASECDRRTAQAIAALEFEGLRSEDACGYRPIQGLLAVARHRGLDVHLLDRRNSGDTAGSRDRVVGYASFALD